MPEKPSTQKKRGRGRPAHEPTAATRRRVAVAAGGGMRHEDIAIALGIARETLARHYSAELTEGALSKRLEVLNAMHTAAKRGQSSAARVYLEHAPQLAAPPVPAGEPAAPTQPKAVTLGKKEQAQADAVTAAEGTDWDALLKPRPVAH